VKRTPSDISLAEINSRIRGFLLDSQIQDAADLAVIIGCTAISEEVEDKEYEESDKRVSRVSSLIPLMYAYSHTLAEAATEYQKKNLDSEVKIPDEVWAFSRKLTEQIAMSTVLGAVSQLVDMGALTLASDKKKWWRR
jgi:hypothetical protein